jgi:hypothetical protein
MRTCCIHDYNVCSFSNITSYRNRLLLFVKYLSMRIVARKYRIRIHRLVTKFRDTGSVCDHQTLHRQTSFWGFPKGRVHSNNHRSLEEVKHNIEQTLVNSGPGTLCKVARNTKDGGWSSSIRWWAFSASAVKLFCKFFLTNKNKKLVCLVILMSPTLTYTVAIWVAFHMEHYVASLNFVRTVEKPCIFAHVHSTCFKFHYWGGLFCWFGQRIFKYGEKVFLLGSLQNWIFVSCCGWI